MPRIARYVGSTLAVVVLLALAGWLGRQLVASQLALTAQHERHLQQQGLPRWSWDLQQPRQLLASQVFGPAVATADPAGLKLTASAPTSYQLGLRLSAPVDLRHWPRLHLDYRAERGVAMGLIAANSERPACYSPVWSLPAGRQAELRLDLGGWHTAQGDACQPGVAHILRLVVQSPPGRPWQLRRLSLLASAPAAGESGPTIPLPAPMAAAMASLNSAYQRYPQAAAPTVELAAATPAAGLLQLRDAARARWPGAMVVPQATDAAVAAFRLPLAWAVMAAYALAVLALLRHPAPPRQSWLEVIACMAGPLWLIVGMHFGRADPGPSAAACALGLGYAGWLGWKQHHGWQWLGQRAGPWLRPLAVLPAALALSWHPGTAPAWPGSGHVLAYLAWAGLQQLLLLTVILPRLQRSLPNGLALPATAGLFMLLHSPNSELMQCCLLAELYWTWCFQRDRSLLPVAIGHAGAALIVQAGAGPQGLIRSLEVSARFLN